MATNETGGSQGAAANADGQASDNTRPTGEVRPERRLSPQTNSTEQQPITVSKPVAIAEELDIAPARRRGRRVSAGQADEIREPPAGDNTVEKIALAERSEVVSPQLDADLERQLDLLAQERAAQNAKALDDRRRTELPPELATRYVRDGERVYDKGDTSRVAFLDRGEVIKTAANDIETVRAIVILAESRGWDAIKISGAAAFRREVYVEAAARGIKVAGYTPTREDVVNVRVRAEKFLERNAVRRAVAGEVAAVARAAAVVGEGLRRKAKASPDAEEAARVSQRLMKKLHQDLSTGLERGDRPRDVQVRVPQGVYIEAGAAKYNFDPKENDSFYVRYRDANTGEVKVRWGRGLQQALIDAKAQPGDTIRLERAGARAVQVQANLRDQQNRIVETKVIDAQRNEWKVEVVERKIEKERPPPTRGRGR